MAGERRWMGGEGVRGAETPKASKSDSETPINGCCKSKLSK